MCLGIIYLLYKYNGGLVLNDLQWLICNKTKPNQTQIQAYCVSTFFVILSLCIFFFFVVDSYCFKCYSFDW